MRNRLVLLCISLTLLWVLVGCGPSPEDLTATAQVIERQETQTAEAKIPTETQTPTPTETEVPSATPTETEVPSATPTNTEIPDTPTNTSVPPTNTSVPPTQAPASDDTGSSGSSGGQTSGGTINCNQQSAGAVKIRVENLTDGPLGLYFYGADNYACTIPLGAARIYVKTGTYSLTASMCGGTYSLGTGKVSPTWYFQIKCP
ncbi:MAG: hypothetical protein JXB38_15500 [Anaerolineales bacterium]|nr:hypothetical protein [Anaerolineales bacterium]